MVVGVQTKEIKQVQLGIWQKYSRNILMAFKDLSLIHCFRNLYFYVNPM